MLAQNLSARVEEAIKLVLGGESDELDGPHFDVVAFINKRFPDEKSLEGLDAAIAAYDSEAKALDETVLETVREQSTAGTLAARDIADAKDSIGDLQHKIVEIKMKAKATEQLVETICKDIRGLDIAKKHLEMTINSLTRLKNLVYHVERMKEYSAAKSYEEVSGDFEGAVALLLQFSDYLHVPKIREISHVVEAIRDELKRNVSEDFEDLLDTVTPSAVPTGPMSLNDEDRVGRDLTEDNITTLAGLYQCVDALGSSVRTNLLRGFIRKQLKPYDRLFRHGGGTLGSTLEGVEQRYVWFRAALKALDSRYGRSLPKRWRVEHRLAIEFCNVTRTDVEGMLQEYNPPTSVPAEALLGALLKTFTFEKEMVKKYEGADFLKDVGAAAGIAEQAGMKAGGGGGGKGGEEPEDPDLVYDESAPLYNKEGKVVDPLTGEGIRLKYALKKELEEKRKKAAEKRSQKAEQRAQIAALGGWERGKSSGSVGQASLTEELGGLPRFMAEPREGLISGAFKPYLPSYVLLERARIDSIVGKTTWEDMKRTGNNDATLGSTASASVLQSAEELFTTCNNAVMRCVQLSTGDTLFSLYDNIRMSMEQYAGRLRGLLPAPVKKEDPRASSYPGWQLGGETYAVPYTPRESDVVKVVDSTGKEMEALKLVDATCLIFTTAEFCADTVSKFAEVVVKQYLDPQYKSLVNSEALQDPYFRLSSVANATLSSLAASLCDSAFQRLYKFEWSKVNSVGDQSAYVGEMTRTLRRVFSIARRRVARLDDTPYRSFCDKFAKAFIPRYQTAVQQCKKINETGAQQLLLDVQAIKGVLLSLPSTPAATERALAEVATTGVYPEDEEAWLSGEGGGGGSSGGGESGGDSSTLVVPKAYIQFVTKELQRLELMVKIVASPKEKFAVTIRALWPGCQEESVRRFLEMKDMSKADQDDVMRALGFTVRGGGSGVLPGIALGGWGGMVGGGSSSGSGAGGGGGSAQRSAGGQQQQQQQSTTQQQQGGGQHQQQGANQGAATGQQSTASRMTAGLGMGKLFGGGGPKK